MFRWLRFYIEICLLKAAPQDAPSSKTVLYLTVLFYWAAGAALTSLNQSFLAAVFIAFLQTILVLFFINLALWIRKFPERISQTITAFTGSGLILTLIAFPVIGWLSQAEASAGILYTIFWLSLVLWETVIVGYIFKHALEIPFYASIGVALILMYMSFAITLRFLKLMSVSLT
jgi:hypothetical protein